MSQEELFITHNGFVTLLQNLGYQFKYIEVNSSDGILTILNILNTLNNDKQIVQINTLFSASRQSFGGPQLWNQGRFIQEITITIDAVTSRTLFYLGYIKTLKKLKVGYLYHRLTGNEKVRLNSLLFKCSDSLEPLEIYDFDINLNNMVFHPYSLEELVIHSISISQEFYQFISRCLPNLKHLKMDQLSNLYGDTIMLNVNDPQSLEVLINNRGFIMISTLSDHQVCYYSLGTYKMSEFQSAKLIETQSQCLTKRITLDQVDDFNRIVRLIYGSIRSLTINKRIAF